MYDKHLISEIGKHLYRNNQTIAVAESVTSGHLQAALSLAEGASDFFQGGITTYTLEQKTRHLHIDHEHALQCNCVSEQVSVEMALNTAKMFLCDWSVAVTGYAAPVPELGIEQLFAYFAIVFRNKTLITKKILAEKDSPEEVQRFYTNEILRELLHHLERKNQKKKSVIL
jgi:nicotinamide-nucleotide amidase